VFGNPLTDNMTEGKTGENYDPACLPDLLPVYYKRLFPYGPYYKWLNYGGGDFLYSHSLCLRILDILCDTSLRRGGSRKQNKRLRVIERENSSRLAQRNTREVVTANANIDMAPCSVPTQNSPTWSTLDLVQF